MSDSRISSARRTSRRRRSSNHTSILSFKRFVGVSLAGGKSDRTGLVVIDYYPDHQKLFVSQCLESLRESEKESADEALLKKLNEDLFPIETIAWDSPLSLPLCMECHLKCPGAEKCKQPQIGWMWRQYRKMKSQNKKTRFFTPYTQRCAEIFLAHSLEESFFPNEALGANAAPLAARLHFLKKRIRTKDLVEVFAKAALWRMGGILKVSKSHLRYHRHSFEGSESRHIFLDALLEKKVVFLYQTDIQKMMDHPQLFDAFICAMTAYLRSKGQVEVRPAGFPKKESWIEIPIKEIEWA